MGIIDYLSREPNGKPWPESKLDRKFVVTSNGNFHKALYCLNSRLNYTKEHNQSENILEYFCRNTGCNDTASTSSYGSNGNQIGS